MITNSIHILLPVFLLMIGLFCYKSDGKTMTRFYLYMAYRHCWRRLYTLMLLLILLLFHFNYINMAHCIYDLAPSSVAFIFLLRHPSTERIIYYIQNRRTLFITAIIGMACLFIPFFFSTAVTIEVLLFGSIFYPSRKVREIVSFPDYHNEIMERPREILNFYYRWSE